MFKIKNNRTIKEINKIENDYSNNKISEEEYNEFIKEFKEVGYWRKNWELNDYIQNNIWRKQIDYNPDIEFNCIYVELSIKDLNDMKSYFKKDKYILEIINDILDRLKEEERILYFGYY